MKESLKLLCWVLLDSLCVLTLLEELREIDEDDQRDSRSNFSLLKRFISSESYMKGPRISQFNIRYLWMSLDKLIELKLSSTLKKTNFIQSRNVIVANNVLSALKNYKYLTLHRESLLTFSVKIQNLWIFSSFVTLIFRKR